MTPSGPGSAGEPDLTADRVPARQEPSAIASADSGGGRNVELKATDPSQEASIEACRKLGAVDCGVLCSRTRTSGRPMAVSSCVNSGRVAPS